MTGGVALLLVAFQVQDPGAPPPAYTAALEHLTAHDTAAALPLLREATRQASRFGPAFLRLGSVLSAQAGEVPSQFRERLEAERALQRARQLLGDDPEVLLEFGLLLRKQQSQIDARRVLERAARAAERRGQTLAPEARARINYALGVIYESWWEDWEALLSVNLDFTGSAWCRRIETPLEGSPMEILGMALIACPQQWSLIRQIGVPLADMKAAERTQMLWHFREALRADSNQAEAALHLLGYLAEDGEWSEFNYVARRVVALRPEDPRGYLFLGLADHERGRDSAAAEELGRGIALLPSADRRVFEDIALLLPGNARAQYLAQDSAGRLETARVFFTATNPLFLTGVDERRLEHYARLAWADLKFGAADGGQRGWDTDRGRIWVRYGPPADWFQCCYGGQRRRVFWSYGERGPVFVFRKQLTYRNARFTDPANFLAAQLDRASPQLYRPRTVTDVHGLPLQLVRFRGSRADYTRVEVYALPPVDSLGDSTAVAFETGMFVFDRYYQPMWSGRRVLRRVQARAGINYQFEIRPGVFRYGVEARADAPASLARPAARVRDSLVVTGFTSGRLSVSDLLLADSLLPLVENPRTREELRLWPSRTLAVAEGAPIHVYFELYDLAVDADSLGRYQVEVSVEDSTRRHPITRILRGLAQLVSGPPSAGSLTFTRVARVGAERTPEFLTVQLGGLGEGDYAVRVRARDEATGGTAETVRRFRILRR